MTASLTPAGFRPRIAGLLLLLVLLVLAARPAASLADACTDPGTNAIACENSKLGTDPSVWQIDGAGDQTIQGFATQMSVNKGQTVNFKIKSSTSNYHVDIYRLGYYGGLGARLWQGNIKPTNTATQPACRTENTGLVDCGTWAVSASWAVPSNAVSGVYIARLVRNDTGGASHIIFVVRDDASTSAVMLQTSDATWQAYNTYGGNSLYQCTTSACPNANPSTYYAAFKVSYNRPLHVAEDDGGRSALFTGGEWPLIRFLERNGYDMTYTSGVDTESRGALIKNHKLFISSGHDEYWSQNQRDNVRAARDAGTNLAFFSGNEMFWRTRYEPSTEGSNTPNRTLVSYKDTHFTTQQDPVSFTGTWRDPRMTPASSGVIPENELTGQSFVVNSGTAAITVPAAYGKLRLWRNTAAASLSFGSLTLAPSTLGYEWDVDADNGYRPAGLVRLSSTTVSGVEVFADYGSSTTLGTATHNLTMYKAASGAKVFGAGTVQWAWGLDDDTPVGNTPNQTMMQATVNLLADMGAQPATRMSGLVAATASADTTAPIASVTSAPATVADGTKITISGTATDGGGGQVAGVEVSTDGGTTWHPATSGTTSWTYSWTAHGSPSSVIKARATDDSGNRGAASAGVTVGVTCPCSIWGNTITPAAAGEIDSADPSPVEVGVKFTSDAYGTITGLRFYKATANTGTHVGSLWSASGERLAQATFQNESSSGWQTVTFATPVEVLPNTTYIASYYAPNGHYSATTSYFERAPAPGPNGGAVTDSPPLHAPKNVGTTTNGVYNYGSSAFPNSTYGATNYWVDVVFAPLPAPGAVSNVSAVEGGTSSANVTWTAPTTGGPVTKYTITPYDGTTALTPKVITGTPPLTSTTVTGLTTGKSYTFTVRASNPTGDGPVSAKSNVVTPSGPVVPAAPTGVAAKPASNQARVTWSAPSSDGDSAITAYVITPYVGAVAQPTTQVGGSATSATVTGLTNGTAYTFKVRAVNAVGTGAASDASSAVTPQATIFDFADPAVADSGDTTPAELGVKFKADSSGTITGVRFYKAAANTGTHTGSLWTAGGQRLAQATFTNESASGWQTATFATPISVTAGTTYVASYYAPFGRYSVTSSGMTSGADNGLLHAIPDTTSANGVYVYSSSSTFPASTYRGSNYWVDVLYAVPVPGQVTGVTASPAGKSSADVSWTAPSTGGTPTSYVVTPYVGSSPQPSTTVTGTPLPTAKTITGLTSGTTYTFVVRAQNANGLGAASSPSNAVTPTADVAPSAPTNVSAEPATSSARVTWAVPANDGGSPITGYRVTPYVGTTAQTPTDVGPSATATTVSGLTNGTTYTFKVAAINAVGTGASSTASSAVMPQRTIYDFTTPGLVDSGDTDPTVVGVKFKADSDGWITGIRFYKAAANTGTHVGTLWTAAGAVKAQATFTAESASGWQSATFSTPVAVTADTTYVASYFAPSGHYSVTSGGLASGVDNGQLHAIANDVSPNGVFSYAGSSAFPTGSFNAGDYGVDVLFALAPPPGQVTGVTATAGQASATVSWTAPSTGGTPTSYKVTPYVGSTAQTAKTVTGTPPATTTTVTGLTPGTAYTFRVEAVNAAGTGPASDPSASVTPLGAVAPGAPTGVSAIADATSAVVSWTPPASDGGSSITGYTVTPETGGSPLASTTVDGSTTATRITGLTNGTAYTFTVKATSSAGTSAASSASSAVTPRTSVFDLATPPTADSGDTDSVVVGMKFRSDVAGSATGMRFFKAAANTGTHIGTLYDATGQVLASVTFSQETASGWQPAAFSTPVQLTAGATYVVSYVARNGHYSATGGVFADNPVDNGALHALATTTSPNGVYAYSTTPTFPTSSFNATNYWVDVLFAPAG